MAPELLSLKSWCLPQESLAKFRHYQVWWAQVSARGSEWGSKEESSGQHRIAPRDTTRTCVLERHWMSRSTPFSFHVSKQPFKLTCQVRKYIGLFGHTFAKFLVGSQTWRRILTPEICLLCLHPGRIILTICDGYYCQLDRI